MSELDNGPTKHRGPSKIAPMDRRAPSKAQLNSQQQKQQRTDDVDDIYRELEQPIRGGRGAAQQPGSRMSAVPPSTGRSSVAVGRGGAAGGRGIPPGRGGNSGGGDTSDLDSILGGLDEPGQSIGTRGLQKVPEAVPKGVCSGCRKPVPGEAIHALGRTFHPEHFMCSTCGKGIGTGSFYEKEGQPQCDRCYQSVFCKRCAACNLPITTQLVTAMAQPWHPKCFVCTSCRSTFANGSFFERDSRPYCGNCFNSALNANCRRCNMPVDDSVVNALGTTWHAHHFSCETCGVLFPDGQFWELDSLPYCETHYREMLGDEY